LSTLFPEFDPDVDDVLADAPAGPFAVVALEQAIDRVLDYAVPARLVGELLVGQRVRCPLGRKNRPASGYVVAIAPSTRTPAGKIKSLFGIDDARVLVDEKLMELARWMARYYVAPLGTVLESIIPSAVKKKTGLGYLSMVYPAVGHTKLQELLETIKTPKRRAILARLLQLEEGKGIEIIHLAGESGVTPATLRKLARTGIIHIKPEADLPRLGDAQLTGGGVEKAIALNEDQQKVFDDLAPRLVGGFSVNLLLGVTGSGKTEVYLQAIRRVVDAGKQAIVLVPEIALTPQTQRRFLARFANVAVLHSGLTPGERHRYWQQIKSGRADVVVGARSAIFAPVTKLGMIVVDEEHESSYKQDSAPRYHARDVAIKRAQLEAVPILLGSATPSMESYRRVQGLQAKAPISGHIAPGNITTTLALVAATPALAALNSGASPSRDATAPAQSPHPEPKIQNPYHLLHLPRRVRGLSMPAVELVDMKVEAKMRRGVHLIGVRLEHLLRTTLESGHQAILLLNRRGYSSFIYCAHCKNPIKCKYCDTTMTYHRSTGETVQTARTERAVHTGQMHCHYCLAVNPMPQNCPVCQKQLVLFGLGTQRVEEELLKKFPGLSYARVDSDTMRNSRDYEALLNRFAEKEIKVMLGTQMIAKGLDYPNVTLVGVISGDTALALPDFRSGERTFQLITQVAGRAGRGDAAGRVVLQTFMPDDPTIQSALRQDYEGFASRELHQRRDTGLPPYARMARIVIRDEDQDRLFEHSEHLAGAVAEAVAQVGESVTMKGPMPCAINRIAGYYRNQILLISPAALKLQHVLQIVRDAKAFVKNERIAVDVDPVSLL